MRSNKGKLTVEMLIKLANIGGKINEKEKYDFTRASKRSWSIILVK